MVQLRGFLRPYRLWVTLAVTLTFLQSMSNLYLPKLMSHVVDTGVVRGNVSYILAEGLWMLVVTVVGAAAVVGSSYFAARTTAGFGQDLRRALFGHVEAFSLQEFDRWGTSSLIVRSTNDVMQIQQAVFMVLRMMVMAPLTMLGGIIMAIDTDARLSPIIVVVLPLMGLAVWGVMGRGLGLFRAIQTKVDVLNRVLREYLTGVRVIRSFGRSPYETQRFDASNTDLTDTSVRVFQLMATMQPLVMLIMNVATIAIVWFGARQIDTLHLQIGQLMAFIQYVGQIMFSVMMASMMLFMLPRAQASAVRVHEVLALPPTIRDAETTRAPSAADRGVLEFRDVTFRYPGAEEPALAGISFTASPGEITAIIGGTGAGKSTLLNLICRFFDVSEGSVRVGGVDVREMGQETLRHRIGYVPQRAVLFTGSVADNVRYGDLEASDAAVRHAVSIAQAAEFVRELGGGDLDAGLGAVISQGGTNLSGGQRQRLAIARALARKGDVYLFDDSFSALDYRTDARLRAALRHELKAATVVVVAQRVSTVMDADRILVLDDGRLVGSGTHRELLHSCPVYREIVESQLSAEEIA